MTHSEVPTPIRSRTASALEPLWRHLLGRRLRMLRLARGDTLIDTAGRAGVSPQYLSEIERGLKEPSSEMIAAIAGALGVTLLDLTEQLSEELRGSGGIEPRHEAPRHEVSHHEIGRPASNQIGGTVSTLSLASAA